MQRLPTEQAAVRVGRTPPFAFASSCPLTRAQLVAAPVRFPAPSRLLAPLEGISPKLARSLAAMRIETVGSLLDHLPRRTRPARTIATLRIGEPATIRVQVKAISRRAVPRRRGGRLTLVQAEVADESGQLTATFYNQPWLAERYTPGTTLLLHGTLRGRRGFGVSHHAPASVTDQSLCHGDCAPADAVAHYPGNDRVSSTQILNLIQAHRQRIADVVEPLPARITARNGLPHKAAALTAMHFPADADRQEEGRRRIAFEELLLGQLALQRRRALLTQRRALPLDRPRALTARWLEEVLPFRLTADQERAIEQIDIDLAASHPMQRLLMGEVGSGKTVVALYAMLRAVEHGMQAALMTPSGTLAEQHFATLLRLAPPGLVSCALLTGATPSARRRQTLGGLATGALQMLVGTHALIEGDVEFARLGVVIVDEQHKFGVAQRTALTDRDPSPHALHLSATPIPRTLWLTSYAELDLTQLKGLPQGRRQVRTHIASSAAERSRAYRRLVEETQAGRQAFVVCPLVSESEQLEAKAATAEHERLCAGELAGLRVGLIHGQMPQRERQETMEAFVARRLDVLVATTIIEVGIDVSNATVMLIEDAERYGISQLHQLRGRVGRGSHQGLCILFGRKSSPRLRALAEHSDGFRLSEIDLQLRGEGDLQDAGEGVRQSGRRSLRVANMPGDADLLERAAACARELHARDPHLRLPEHALLAEELSVIPA